RQGGVAAPAEQPLLELEAQGRRQQERNREGGGLLDFRRVLEEGQELGRDRVEAGRQGEDGRRAEERQRLEHGEDEAADDRRERQRQRDRQRHAQAARAEDRAGLLQVGGDELERVDDHDVDVGERVER